MHLTNKHNLPISVALWLLQDDYDYDPTAISATSLLRPLKQQILSSRIPTQDLTSDLSDYIASRMGTALHDAIERAWNSEKRLETLKRILPEHVAEKIVINPEKVEEGQIPVYMEIRKYKTVNGVRVSGKFDFLFDGKLEDFKSTSVYSFLKADKTEKFKLQGSIYRYLADDIIHDDVMQITYIFTDWQKSGALTQPNYPPARIVPQQIPLYSIEETEQYIKNRLELYKSYKDAPEEALPSCSDEDLWRTESVWKYYSNPDKTDGRSTKNFTSPSEAFAHKATQGKGVVLEVKGRVNACKYCRGFAICKQKNEYLLDGTLVIED